MPGPRNECVQAGREISHKVGLHATDRQGLIGILRERSLRPGPSTYHYGVHCMAFARCPAYPDYEWQELERLVSKI